MASSLPPGLDLNETAQPRLWAVMTLSCVLPVIVVSLRLLCRRVLSNAGLWWDDYCICIALVVALSAFSVTISLGIGHGLGTHIFRFANPLEPLYWFLLDLFIGEILYAISIMLTKFSILAFYWRIFGCSSMRFPIYGLVFVVLAWALGVIFAAIFQCWPIQAAWDQSITTAHCGVDTKAFFIGTAIPNIITDWILLILPLPYIWRLQRDTAQKLALCGVFALGGFICIISIYRLVVFLTTLAIPSKDVTWIFTDLTVWTAVEMSIGIVAACLPSLRPIITLLVGTAKSLYGRHSSGTRSGLSGGQNGARTPSEWPRSKRTAYIRTAEEVGSKDDTSTYRLNDLHGSRDGDYT